MGAAAAVVVAEAEAEAEAAAAEEVGLDSHFVTQPPLFAVVFVQTRSTPSY